MLEEGKIEEKMEESIENTESSTPRATAQIKGDEENQEAQENWPIQVEAYPIADQSVMISYIPRSPVTEIIRVRPVQNQREDMMTGCAIVGFIFSWIPIVGILTFCVNLDAPPGSNRRIYASLAFVVSLVVLMFNIIYWPFYISQ